MRTAFTLLPLLALSAACAATPKSLNPGTDVSDGPSVLAPSPAPSPSPSPAASGTGGQDAAGGGDGAVRCDLVRVSFAFDSAQLDPAARQGLQTNATCLSRRHAASLLIEGHCDERGTAQYNVALGARRADAVRRYLADLGVTTRLETVSFGKELPLSTAETEQAFALNRRAEFRLPGEKRSDGRLVAGK